ncbi:MAG: hypothetical protein ACRC5H_08675 [Treponemataceae bacterium]
MKGLLFQAEQKLKNWILNNYFAISIISILLVSLFVRYTSKDVVSGDMTYFLLPWFDKIKSDGGFFALKNFPGNYNVPYMTIMALLTYIPMEPIYLIKAVSVFFDYVLVFATYLILFEILRHRKKALFLACMVLFLPSLMFNSARWGQCDAIYASFVLFAFYFFLKNKYFYTFIMLGCSFSFKLQFAFIIPFFVFMYFFKKISVFHFFLIPVVNIILCLPGIFMGKNIIDCLLIYFNQTGQTGIVANYPNLYSFISSTKTLLHWYGVGVAILICILTLTFIIYKKIKFNNQKYLILASWIIYAMVFFLPGMHERYLYVAEILIVLYFFIYHKGLVTAILVTFISYVIYLNYLTGFTGISLQLLTILNLASLFLYTKLTFETLSVKELI